MLKHIFKRKIVGERTPKLYLLRITLIEISKCVYSIVDMVNYKFSQFFFFNNWMFMFGLLALTYCVRGENILP